MLRLFFIFVGCFFCEQTFSQSKPETIDYSRLLKYKVDENRFDFGWLPNAYRQIPCLRDYPKNKIKTQLVDPIKDSIIYTSTDPEMNSLKIIPSKITLDKKNKLFQIDGQITGGWESVMSFEFEIYIGHRHDTISDITLSPNLHSTFYFNGVKVDSTIVVDRVSAFYLTNFKKFNAFDGIKNMPNSKYKEMLFSISSVIDDNSILIFGLSSGYSEIFKIGNLLIE